LSFSGIKAAVSRLVDDLHVNDEHRGKDPSQITIAEKFRRNLTPAECADVAAAFQYSAISHVTKRLEKALKWCKKNLPFTIQRLVSLHL
jgi:tRNA A37 threonylcarbamoyltransferase TsaD